MSAKATSVKTTISGEATSPAKHMSADNRKPKIKSGVGTSSKKTISDEPASPKEHTSFENATILKTIFAHAASSSSALFLDKLQAGVTETIIVMLCRIWDVSAIIGRYLSTDMAVSNPNKEEYRTRKDDTFMLEFDGATSARKSLAKSDGFVRHPFQLVELDSVEVTENKYMIDVTGYITNVGSVAALTKEVMLVDFTEPRATAEMMIDNIRTRKGWNFPMYGREKCKKGLNRKLWGWYRLELGVSDETSHVVVVMFDETASELVKFSADSITQAEEESLDDTSDLPATLTNIIGGTDILELKSHTYYEHGPLKALPVGSYIQQRQLEELEDSNAESLPSQAEGKKKKRCVGFRIVSEPYPNFTTTQTDDAYLKERAILTLRNDDVDAINAYIFKKLDGEPVTYNSADDILTPSVQANTRVALKQKTADLTSKQPCGRSKMRITGREPYTFRINGQNYHRIGSLLPKEGIQPRLIEMLNQSSSIAKEFWIARDWFHSHGSINVELKLLGERTKAQQYNKPTVAEVAALITNDFGDSLLTRDIIVDSKDTRPKQISELHPSYMALQYHLLFPYGEHQRNNQGTTLLRGGQIFQQYLVDAFTDVEEQRLKWTRNNQDALRVDLYHNVCDAVTRGDTNAEGLEKRIALPGTFTVIYVIEFPKRGLPHVHILLWLEEHCKCSNPSEIDDIILAKIPCQAEDPEGYKLVTEFMLHGPCGKDAKSAPCNMKEKCSTHFPKALYVETIIDVDGYPIYRRRDNKAFAMKGNFKFDNK
ncbi:ATP-dependent DNA helicase PIF1-like protein [Tanacetum coccineum]|uniref:ATP-dependent DNA helicase PIF1-like protein n=1 Tax=Tanacetum coccineum TaxID=301880 RepID=A0ABQ5FMN5_9ASTR